MDKFLQESTNLNYIKENIVNIKSSNGLSFTEQEIFAYYKGKENFIKRAERIEEINNNEIDKIKNKNIQLEKEINKINEMSLKEILENISKERINEILENQINDKFEIDNFTLMLVSNGYIDENYKNYMFYFKPTKEINKNDYTYIINVRQSIESEFDYKIDNPKVVIKELDSSYFSKKEILNYYILEELLKNNSSKENKEKLEKLIEVLLEVNDNTQDFVFGFLRYTKMQSIFLQKLYNSDNGYIKEVLIYNIDDETKKHRLEYWIKVLLNNPSILKNNEANSYIKKYIEEKVNVENWLELNEKSKEALIILNIKIKHIDDIENKELISFIYENNLYFLNVTMIKLIFKYKGYSEQDCEDKNLTLILHDEKLKKIKEYVYEEKEQYINNCYLKTLEIKNKPEDVEECLNLWDIKDETKRKMIENLSFKFKNIRDVKEDYYIELMENNVVEATWKNYYYFYCYEEEQITDELISNIELNINDLKQQKASSIIMPDEDKNRYIDFRAEIIKNNKIDIEVYKQIVLVCGINLEIIEKNKIEDERLKILVKNNRIKLNDDNLQVINEQIPEVLDVYINNNIESFINETKNYSLDENIISNIVKSEAIRFRYKTKIINSIDIVYINEESMEYIINNYSTNKISRINENLKNQMFESTLDIDCKLLLLYKELNRTKSKEVIDNYLRLLPEPYKYIGIYNESNRVVSIPKTEINENILKMLENMGFRFSKTKKNKSIMIYNKKN